ncbi:MAG: ribbon-helix-helix domain-containing protein [Nostoc sp.]
MPKKKGTIVYLPEEIKKKLENIAEGWGVSQSSAMQRLIREHKEYGE